MSLLSLFRKKTSLASSGIFAGATDCHSHILPGVDDGMSGEKGSLAAIQYEESLGIRNLWLTPHIMEDVPNTTEGLTARFEELKAMYGGNVSLHLGAEYMIDALFIERLEKRDILFTYEPDMVLVETRTLSSPMDLDGIMSKIQSMGYWPLLAHPERYIYLNHSDYNRLWHKGVKFQLNLASLSGGYGYQEQQKALTMLNEGMYYCCGTDTHTNAQLHNIFESKTIDSKVLEQLRTIVSK